MHAVIHVHALQVSAITICDSKPKIRKFCIKSKRPCVMMRKVVGLCLKTLGVIRILSLGFKTHKQDEKKIGNTEPELLLSYKGKIYNMEFKVKKNRK